MAKKSELTVENKLRALYDLQLIDSRIDEIRNLRGELPLEVEDLESEIAGLNKRLEKFKNELNEMLENGIRFQTIGRTHKFPDDVRKILEKTIEKTAGNKDMVLTLALSYGGRQELTDAIKKIAHKIESGDMTSRDITEQGISHYLYNREMPEPDLLIRTSGEYRVSNFLLWQIAYTEIYVTSTLWPDFRKEAYLAAIEEYQKRERRFGATGDQVSNREGL